MQIAAGIVAGVLEAGVAALVALRFDVLGLELLLLLREAAARRCGVRHYGIAESGVEAAASGGGSCSRSLVLATHPRW